MAFSPSKLVLPTLLFILLQLLPALAQDGREVNFLFYPAKSNYYRSIIASTSRKLCPKDFNPLIPTRVLIHDWKEREISESILSLRRHYNALGNYNQIVVVHTKALLPDDPSRNVKVGLVGREIAKVLVSLNSTCNMPLNKTVLVGLGIGAHIAGNAGKWVQRWKKPDIATIFGLDPTPDVTGYYSLNKMDAKGVVVYHTNTVALNRLGTVDIYANDQVKQPGCTDDLCSQQKALGYFLDAPRYKLTKCRGIPGTEDPRCHESKLFAEVNSDTDFNCGLRGVYLLQTKEQSNSTSKLLKGLCIML